MGVFSEAKQNGANSTSIKFADFDKDGIKDMLVCGNNNDADVSTGNYDATAALLLKGNASGKFTTVDYVTSGLKIKGEVRKMIYLKEKKLKNLKLIIVSKGFKN